MVVKDFDLGQIAERGLQAIPELPLDLVLEELVQQAVPGDTKHDLQMVRLIDLGIERGPRQGKRKKEKGKKEEKSRRQQTCPPSANFFLFPFSFFLAHR